jgi:hypothetical protein
MIAGEDRHVGTVYHQVQQPVREDYGPPAKIAEMTNAPTKECV